MVAAPRPSFSFLPCIAVLMEPTETDEGVPTAIPPVFSDPSGRRWRTLRGTALGFGVVTT